MQIPFFPLVKKDLTFIHFGNDSRVDGLVNFEKLRMIAKEVRRVTSMSRADSTARHSTAVSLPRRHRCYSAPDSGAEYCDERVCLFCLSVCLCVCVCLSSTSSIVFRTIKWLGGVAQW